MWHGLARVAVLLPACTFLAKELPRSERTPYLEKVCGGDRELRARVEQMLAVSEKAEAFIEDPPDAATQEGGSDRSDSPDEVIGQAIDRYKLLEQIGDGPVGVSASVIRHDDTGHLCTVQVEDRGARRLVAVADVALGPA